MKNYD
jgi:tetratricopeptide (TPR) repeat protein